MSRELKTVLIALAGAIVLLCGCVSVASLGSGLDFSLSRKVGVVRIEGEITSGAGMSIGTPVVVDRRIIADLRRAEENRSVGAILLYMNTPGGDVVASDQVYRALREVKKPVVVYMGGVAASGGYYIACGADEIMAHPATITGSIGVITYVPNLSELFEKVGIELQVVKSGAEKDMGNPGRPLTVEEEGIWQAIIDDAYEDFVDVVASERGLPRERVLELADGRVYSGKQAYRLELVDELGTFEDAVLRAGELAGIKGRPETVEITVRPSLLQALLSSTLHRGAVSALNDLTNVRERGLYYLLTP